MAIKIEKNEKPLSPTEIRIFEKKTNQNLPHDYKHFLLEYNGGIPENNFFDIPQANNDSGVLFFFSLEELLKTKTRMYDRMPPSSWPIASAEGGNYVCLVIGEKEGVFFWDHEMEQEEGTDPTWDNMFLISQSFEDFLDTLKPAEKVKSPIKAEVIYVNPELLAKYGKKNQ